MKTLIVAHTPTPRDLTIREGHRQGIPVYEIATQFSTREQVEKVVRAVNAHEELLAALKASATMTNELLRTIDEGHWYSDDLVALRVKVLQAIAKAEGK